MKNFSWICAILLTLIPQFSYCYFVSGGLLQHVNVVGKESETFSIEVINDEKEEIICDVEYGYLEMRKDGSVIIHKIDNDENYPLIGPAVTDPIPAGERGKVSFRIERAKAPKNADCLTLGILVTKKAKPIKFNSTEQISAGLQIVQNYLFQVYAQMNRANTGKFVVENFDISDEKIAFEITNTSQQVAEPELIIFLNKGKDSLQDPIRKKMRILPDVTRKMELNLQEAGVTKAQVFIDDPNFEIFQKEITR
jgi:hypothetical protein